MLLNRGTRQLFKQQNKKNSKVLFNILLLDVFDKVNNSSHDPLGICSDYIPEKNITPQNHIIC